MRIRTLLATALAAVAALAGAPTAAAVQPAIIGGVEADQTYPFMASLQTAAGLHRCGGSLIAPTWVVTAAHCVETRSRQVAKARVGSNDHAEGGEEATVAEVVAHPDYDPEGAGADIALVRLAEPVKAAPITIGAAPAVGTATRLLGWGQTCPTEGCGESPRMLQQLDTRIVEPAKCTADFAPEVELCTDNPERPEGRAGSCYGDSGGPQLVRVEERWELVGATSRPGNGDRTCATAPSVYTSVPAYQDWIAKTTQPPKPPPDPAQSRE